MAAFRYDGISSYYKYRNSPRTATVFNWPRKTQKPQKGWAANDGRFLFLCLLCFFVAIRGHRSTPWLIFTSQLRQGPA
jgi:hypothetical protein